MAITLLLENPRLFKTLQIPIEPVGLLWWQTMTQRTGGSGSSQEATWEAPRKTLEHWRGSTTVTRFPIFLFFHLNGKTMQQFVQYLKVECDRDPLEKYWDRCDVTLCLKHMFELVQCDRKTFLNIFFPLSTDWVANEGSDASEGEGWRRPRLFLSSCPWYHSWLDTPWSHLVDKRKQYISTIGCSSSMTLSTYEQEATQTCLTKREGCFWSRLVSHRLMFSKSIAVNHHHWWSPGRKRWRPASKRSSPISWRWLGNI